VIATESSSSRTRCSTRRKSRRSFIGPFARLRPGSELAEGVHLGNFVETKKTKVGKGSKATTSPTSATR